MEVARHESPEVCWELWRRDPPVALRPHVLGYVGYVERRSAGFRRLEPPSDEVHLIVSFGPRVLADGEEVASFVAAPATRAAVVESLGEQHCVEVRLTPLGTHMVLGVPMHELAERTVALGDVLGAAGDALAERLANAGSWEARFAILDRWLERRLAVARAPSPEVEGAWRRLVATAGSVPVADLVRDAGWSRRHFTVRFSEQVGLTPKTFARVLRFQRAARLLRLPSFARPSLAEIALDCGYFDQAHLNRDFRVFASCTPAELAARRLPGDGGWSAGEVTSVQDAAAAGP